MRLPILITTFCFCLAGCFSNQEGNENCLEGLHLTDSVKIEDVTFYAGSDRRNPILFSLTNGDCSSMEYIRAPSEERLEGFEYDIFILNRNRIAVQYFQRSEGVNSSISFLLSLDYGKTWRSHELKDIDPMAEGIWELSLTDETGIEVKLFKIEKPNQFKSDDNGNTWFPVN